MRHAPGRTPGTEEDFTLRFRVYEKTGRPLGTFSLRGLRERIARGDISASCLVVPQGHALWYPLTELRDAAHVMTAH